MRAKLKWVFHLSWIIRVVKLSPCGPFHSRLAVFGNRRCYVQRQLCKTTLYVATRSNCGPAGQIRLWESPLCATNFRKPLDYTAVLAICRVASFACSKNAQQALPRATRYQAHKTDSLRASAPGKKTVFALDWQPRLGETAGNNCVGETCSCCHCFGARLSGMRRARDHNRRYMRWRGNCERVSWLPVTAPHRSGFWQNKLCLRTASSTFHAAHRVT